ncbi:hypothetical protein BP00DRAFT_476483 [Aspergillus indologenus CBS 114.80]|uniref:P-loop containing nucleoside triphosphate hydrolase protein n=1 Tax=Aspergillus indologenus CBS 114.80 TaxID=1450541 RepID=A0A2V5JH81_9EURO|nr:hypothetical protein BP00DRAFT_476483 [Aspergillus indologenus CBS 114.80]
MPMFDGWGDFAAIVCNKLTESTLSFLSKHLDAKVIIVCGHGGAGKSSYIRYQRIQSGACRHRRLDMPGFNTGDFDDWDIFYKLMTAMAVIRPYVEFRGVLFVDPVDRVRVTPAEEKILTFLFHFRGEDYMSNVSFITTQWDRLNDDGVQDKRDRVDCWKKEQLIRDLTDNGAGFYDHGPVNEQGSYKTLHIRTQAAERRSRAQQMIARRYHGRSTLQLQVCTEVANGFSVETREPVNGSEETQVQQTTRRTIVNPPQVQISSTNRLVLTTPLAEPVTKMRVVSTNS